MGGFFSRFYKRVTPTITAGDCAIKLSVLKLCLRDQIPFELGLLISHALHFQAFNATDNLKATRASHSFLGLNENFTELKSDYKSLFWHVFEKVFCHQFCF